MFPPSYKYDLGTDVYDTSDKQRVPSWTVRCVPIHHLYKLPVMCSGYTFFCVSRTQGRQRVPEFVTTLRDHNNISLEIRGQTVPLYIIMCLLENSLPKLQHSAHPSSSS